MKRLSLLLTVILGLALPGMAASTKPASQASQSSKSSQSSKTKSSTGSKKEVPVRKAQPVEPPFDPTGEAPAIKAGSAIVLNAATGEVLHEVNADQERPVASTQKLMTALLVAEAGNLSQEVEVKTPDTWAEPSMLGIKPGEVYPRNKLLQILLVKSMNDVARCLARDNAGSIEAFADRMNAKATQLGMTRTHFVNPNGLPAPGQYSTARDMAKLAMVAYRNRTIRNIVCMKTLNWVYPDGRVHEFTNTNRVLKALASCNGMKTGYTEASGFCLVSSASESGRDVIVVALGNKRDSIWTDSYKLLLWGLRHR